MATIEDLKDLNPVDEVIAETAGWHIERRGLWWRVQEHDSLVIYPDRRRFVWNSRGWFGDVFEWLERHSNLPFLEAAEWLARRANVEFDADRPVDRQASVARRRNEEALSVATRYMAGLLFGHPPALAWAKERGWTAETLQAARVGFWNGDQKALLNEFKLHEVEPDQDIVRAVLGMPAGMFIYPHFERGRCIYLSGRSIAEKRHYNLPRQLAGPKRVYWNYLAGAELAQLAVVEGQADALTLAQWEVPAVAIAGADASAELLAMLRRYEYVYVALDADRAGEGAADRLARSLGPETRIATWPAGEDVKDANDWLVAGGTKEECHELLAAAPLFAEHLAAAVDQAPPLEREKAYWRAVDALAQLPETLYKDRRRALAQLLDRRLTDLDQVVRERRKEQRQEGKDDRPIVERANGVPAEFDGHLFEMVWNPDAAGGPRSALAVRFPDGRIEVVDRLALEDKIVEPTPHIVSALKERAIRLAPGIAEYGTEAELVERVREFIHKFCDLPDDFERISAFYVLLSYRFDGFQRIPYLRQLGDLGGGKTRWLQTLHGLCFRAHYLTGGASISPIYRIASTIGQVTTIMDECEFNAETEHGRQMTNLFNVGYDRLGSVARSNVDTMQNEYFTVFGPKVMTQRKPFPDDATNSRCLTHESRGGVGVRKDIPTMIYAPEFEPQAAQLRAQLLLFRLRTWEQDVRPVENGLGHELPGRLREIVIPLQTLFKDEEKLQKTIRQLVVEKHRQMIADRAGTMEARILEGILLAWYAPTEEALERDKEAAKSDLERGIYPRMSMGVITERVNEAIDRQNFGKEEEESEGEQEDGDGGHQKSRRRKKVQHTSVGPRIRNALNLRTEQDQTFRNVCLLWNEERVRARAEMYGLAEFMEQLEEEAANKARGIPGFGPME